MGIAGWIDYNYDLRTEEKIIGKMVEQLKKPGLAESTKYIGINVVFVEQGRTQNKMLHTINNKEYIIAFDGEIFNKKELKEELNITTDNDAEIAVNAFHVWQEECVDKLNGVFSFAVWQEENKKLFFIRDRIGVKPLFYYPYNGGIVFGSELKVLLAHPGIKHVINKEGLSELLLLGPGRTEGCGVIKGIAEVLPGEFINYEESGISKHKYWDLIAKEHEDNLNETIEHTRFLVKDALERQLEGKTSVCSMLSGGLDSSIMAKLMSDYYKSQGKRQIVTYSVDYVDNEKYFEKSSFQPNQDNEFIDIMIKNINSVHNKVVIDNEKLAFSLYEAVDARDLPGMADIDSSLLLFAREIAKDYKVAVSGECSDEIFLGYPWYHNEEILYKECFPWAPTNELRKEIIKENVFDDFEEYSNEKYIETINETSKLETDSKKDARMREMFRLNFYWFMQTLVDRGDRMASSSGLDIKMPFCDYRIVEYAYNVPFEYKALNGREKGLLREAVKDILPDEIVNRKKSPYPKTHNPEYLKAVTTMFNNAIGSKNSILYELINIEKVLEIAGNPNLVTKPWYGQLMRAPQMIAYLVQLDYWFNKYNVNIE